MLAFLAAANDRLPGDLSATHTIQDWPFPGEAFSDALRILSGTELVVAVGVVLAVAVWLAGRRRPAIAFAAGLALVVLLQFLLKELVDRPRPPPELVDLRAGFTSASFPSGHTMSATYFYGFLAAAALASPLRGGVRAGVAIVACPLPRAGRAGQRLPWRALAQRRHRGLPVGAGRPHPRRDGRLPEPSVSIARVHSPAWR